VISGVPEAVAALRRRGFRIGSTTGYTREMLDRILPVARAGGYVPDVHVTPAEAGGGRPEPWMCFAALQRMGVFPPAACVKIGDTAADIEEGRNAGMWTIGVAVTGNEIGLTATELASLRPAEFQARREQAYAVLRAAGAHYIADSLPDCLPLIDEIGARLAAGERP
jgi:phosphonoacetaldehyde hydrolase